MICRPGPPMVDADLTRPGSPSRPSAAQSYEANALITIEGAARRYETPAGPVNAVSGATLALEAGQFVALVGASGSGKTTLLNLIAGLDVADEGSIRVGPHLVTEMTEAERAKLRLETIGVIFQDDNLIAEFRAGENVEIPLLARGIGAAEARARAVAAMAEMQISELVDRWPSEMSGGQRQRVGVARALASSQKVLLADEPTGSLDSENSRLLFHHLAMLAHDHDVCVLVATHDPLAHEFADRAITMRDGRIQV